MALRSAITVAMAAAIIAGCARPPASGSPDAPSFAPSATAVAPTSAPTMAPTESPGPTAGVVCPSDLPTTLASVNELADPSCYGATELTIDGWLAESGVWTDPGETDPGWTNPWVKLYPSNPTAGQFIIDFLQADQVPGGISVVTPPRTGIDLGGNGGSVTLRGHFNDAEASACENLRNDGSERDCGGLFVATSLESHPPGSPVCPADELMPVETFLGADARCFLRHDVRIRGWEDVGEGFGGTGPIWRVDYSASLRMAAAQLAVQRFEDLVNEPYVFVWTAKGSGVAFDAPDRQVVVTATLGHPAAQDCRPETYDGWRWSPPVTWAQHYCERMLVITDVRVVD
jgi:hypothetical protein